MTNTTNFRLLSLSMPLIICGSAFNSSLKQGAHLLLFLLLLLLLLLVVLFMITFSVDHPTNQDTFCMVENGEGALQEGFPSSNKVKFLINLIFYRPSANKVKLL